MTPDARATLRARYASRKAAGLCGVCGKQTDRPNGWCSECYAKHQAWRRRRDGSKPGRVPLAPITMPTDAASVGYLAGLFDGEGSVGIYDAERGHHTLQVVVTNTDARLMAWLRVIGGSVQMSVASALGTRPILRWKLYGANAEVFLRAVRPFLIVKAEQTDVALAFRELGQSMRVTVTSEVRAERDHRASQLRLLKHG